MLTDESGDRYMKVHSTAILWEMFVITSTLRIAHSSYDLKTNSPLHPLPQDHTSVPELSRRFQKILRVIRHRYVYTYVYARVFKIF